MAEINLATSSTDTANEEQFDATRACDDIANELAHLDEVVELLNEVAFEAPEEGPGLRPSRLFFLARTTKGSVDAMREAIERVPGSPYA